MLPTRIQRKILPEPNSGCWLWIGAVAGSKGSYGLTSFQSQKKYAHVLVYEILKGPIPFGLELDHLCRNRLCVNPEHLETVTHKENVRRGLAGPKNICRRGHQKVPGKHCRICNTINAQQKRAKNIQSGLTCDGKRRRILATHCQFGHELAVRITQRQGQGKTYCRECNKNRMRYYRASGRSY
jgi:hypothetical protein